MKVLAFIAACFLVISCGQKSEQKVGTVKGQMPPKEENKNLKMDASLLASKQDPVCEMDVSGGFADTASFKGKIYGFCGTGCKEEFVKEPTKFIK